MNLFLNNNSNIELELAVTKMNQNWQKLSSLLNEVRQDVDTFTSKWEQFRKLANELLDVMENILKESNKHKQSVFHSSIERIKEQYGHLMVSSAFLICFDFHCHMAMYFEY